MSEVVNQWNTHPFHTDDGASELNDIHDNELRQQDFEPCHACNLIFFCICRPHQSSLLPGFYIHPSTGRLVIEDPEIHSWQARPFELSNLIENDAVERAPSEVMESSNSAAPAAAVQSAPLPEDSHTHADPSAMTSGDVEKHEMMNPDVLDDQAQVLFDSNGVEGYADHLQHSNVRAQLDGQDVAVADIDDETAANILANGSAHVRGGLQYNDYPVLDPTQNAAIEQYHQTQETTGRLRQDMAPGEPFYNDRLESTPELDRQNATAYAKLVFPDGDYLIKTHDVTLGRNMEIFAQFKRKQKQQARARAELDQYRQEPSQPSQPGDGDEAGNPSTSSQSLEGRPAPPSNYSEHGGPIWFPYSDGEADKRRKTKRRSLQFSKSSSTTSVTPAHLHTHLAHLPNTTVLNADGEPVERTSTTCPIHTRMPEDITKISKQHLTFSFNFQEAQWELFITGNRAFVNEELFEKGQKVTLRHNDEIMMSTVHMTFKLPDNPTRSPSGVSHGTFSRESDYDDIEDEEMGRSPIRRLSNAVDDESEIEEDEQLQQKGNNKQKLKINVKRQKANVKEGKAKPKEKPKKQKKQSPDEESPEAAQKTEKGKKPAKEPAAHDNDPTGAPPAPPNVNPGGMLEGIPLDQLPEKRKGPGRPPKEGNVSKRDTALAGRKKKEYERRGEEPPPFKELVDEVRRETKLREQQMKAAANGQPPPEGQVMQSIEMDNTQSAAGASAATNADEGNPAGNEPAAPPRRASPKPKRTARTPSPPKPESEYTEEELKKPAGTYVHILDEILKNHPAGRADLQEIYVLIMKRYPFYRYRVTSTGWQSSVRHNLLQNERFMENGKSGKGKLWSINHDVPLEKEKKRRVTPPPRPPVPNGQFPNGQYRQGYGQPNQYGNPYGQPQQNGPPRPQGGPGSYYSPYAQHGPYANQGQPGGPNMPHHPGQSQTAGYPSHPRPPGGAPNQQQQAQAGGPNTAQTGPWAPLVNEIMQLRQRYLQQFPNGSEAFNRHQGLFANCTNLLSNLFHGGQSSAEIRGTLGSEDEKRIFDMLDVLFKKYQGAQTTESGGAGTGTGATGAGAGTAAGEVQRAVDNQAANHDIAMQNGDQGATVSQTAPQLKPEEHTDGAPGATVQPTVTNTAPPANNTGEQPSTTTTQEVVARPEPESLTPPETGTKRAASESGDDEAGHKRVKSE